MLRLSSIACLVLLAAAVVPACSKDEKANLSQLGESCERTADCADSLACYGGACRPSDAKITPNSKVCKVIQCEAAADCCTTSFTPSASCATAQSLCAQDATNYASYCKTAAGPTCTCNESQWDCTNNLCKSIQCSADADCCSTFTASSSCTTYADYCAQDATTYASYCTLANGPTCKCDVTARKCNNNQCTTVQKCTTKSDCLTGLADVCSEGVCVQCAVDTDCGSTQKCIGNTCVSPQCLTDIDCPAFSKCESDNTCKAVGCASDRECIAYTSNFLAVCNKSGTPVPTCEVSCQNDAQCSSGTTTTTTTTGKKLSVCVSGKCQNPGCETDEECKILHPEYSTYQGAKAVCTTAP